MHDIYQILTLLVLFQLFFISFFLFSSKKSRKLSNYLLAFFFLSIAAGTLDYYLLVTGFFTDKPGYAFLLNSLVILHVPLLLLYTQSLTSSDFKLKAYHLWHGTPFIVIVILLIIYYYNQEAEQQKVILEDVKSGKGIVHIMISIIGFLYQVGYLATIKYKLKKYREEIKEQFSNLNRINLNWLNYLVNIFIIFVLASAFSNVLRHSQVIQIGKGVILFGMLALLYFINSIMLKGLHQNKIFLGAVRRGAAQNANPQAAVSLLQQLNIHMATNKPYLDTELTLNELASQLNVSPRQLSTFINAELGKSFFDLINGYRIKEAMKILKESDDRKLTILEVMYEVGFNSKSSFNTIFKKIAGCTPSEFRSRVNRL